MSEAATSASSYILEAKGLLVERGGQKVLEIASLQVSPSEVLVFIGPNGSGKTTLLLSLAMLLKTSAGTISYQGQTVRDGSSVLRLRRRLAVVFQEPLLLNTTVWDNVALGLRLRGVGGNEIKDRVEKWLARFGIASLSRRQAKTLSGGEAQRASLARAFALQPEVLFLDEPFAALDTPTRQALTEDFLGVLRETKVTTVMVTHDRNEALTLASRVAVLMNGSVRQIGTPQEIFSSPADEEVASFVGVENILRGTVVLQNSGIATVGLGERQIDVVSGAPVGNKVTVCLRPEDVTISLAMPEAPQSSARNQIQGRIVTMFDAGSQVRLTVDCGFQVVALITRRSYEELGLGIGQKVTASFKASSVCMLPRQEAGSLD